MKIECRNEECELFELCRDGMNGEPCRPEMRRQLLALQQELQEKERQIERMKCCPNCKNYGGIRYHEGYEKCYADKEIDLHPCNKWEAIKG